MSPTPPLGNMKLTALGSGSAFSRQYGTTCSLLELPSGDRWLIDCGRQAPDQLWAHNLTWWNITGQIVTHVHGDHVYGLEDFALMRYYGSRRYGAGIIAGGPKPQVIAHSAVLAETWEVLGPSLRYRSEAGMKQVIGRLEDYFTVAVPRVSEQPRANSWNHAEAFEVEGLRVVARETEHIPGKPACSLEIALDPMSDTIAWWGGDSTVNREHLMALEPRTTVFFHDCTFGRFGGHVHGAFSELRQLPEAIKKKMILMHHDDGSEDNFALARSLGFRILLPGMQCDLGTGALSEPGLDRVR